MGSKTAITWAGATWNPWQGCRKVSAGCLNCYMYRDKKRYGQDPETVVRSKPATFNAPKTWPDPKTVFVCSWSDFLIKEADAWRADALKVMADAQQHTYLLLTKRPERAVNLDLRPHWFGVTIESNDYIERIDQMLQVQAAGYFISYEPALGPIDLPDDCGVDWLICAGESGPNPRAMEVSWARHAMAQCRRQGIPFHFKQVGGHPNKRVALQDIPADLRVREFPNFGSAEQ